MKLPTYDAYQDSGLPWLGKIPAHWEIRRTKFLLREINARSTEGTEQLLRVSQYTGVTPRNRDNAKEGKVRVSSLVGYKKVQRDDLVINIMLAWNGSLGTSDFDGVVSPAYCVYRFRPEVNPHYFHHLLRLPSYKARIKMASTGVVESRLRLYSDDLGAIEAPLPPREEQDAIVRFLTAQDAKFGRLIRAKRQMMALLNEQKSALIHRAVTRGLENGPTKPSGVEWLGEIPVEWEMRRLKQVCSAIIDCKNRTPEMIPNGEYRVVRTTNIRNGKFRLKGSYTTNLENYQLWTERGAPQVGDVFFTREAPVGEACLVPEFENLCMGQRMMYFRPNPKLLEPQFLLYNIYGPMVRRYIEVTCNGSTVGHLRLGQVSSLPILLPPLSEQRAIVAFIEEETRGLDAVLSRLEREIELILEYRTRLICDVVTGTRDVRGVVVSISDVGEFLDLQEGEIEEESELSDSQ